MPWESAVIAQGVTTHARGKASLRSLLAAQPIPVLLSVGTRAVNPCIEVLSVSLCAYPLNQSLNQ